MRQAERTTPVVQHKRRSDQPCNEVHKMADRNSTTPQVRTRAVNDQDKRSTRLERRVIRKYPDLLHRMRPIVIVAATMLIGSAGRERKEAVPWVLVAACEDAPEDQR